MPSCHVSVPSLSDRNTLNDIYHMNSYASFCSRSWMILSVRLGVYAWAAPLISSPPPANVNVKGASSTSKLSPRLMARCFSHYQGIHQSVLTIWNVSIQISLCINDYYSPVEDSKPVPWNANHRFDVWWQALVLALCWAWSQHCGATVAFVLHSVLSYLFKEDVRTFGTARTFWTAA